MQGYIVASAIFGIVYFLIIVGRRRFHIPIWASMLIGVILMLVFQVISLESALRSINLDVIGFLFGMFSIVTALDRAGVLKLIAIRMLARAKDVNSLLLIFVVGMGILSAFLVNDTIALLGIPLIIYISKHIGIRPVVFLISLAFGISVGSTMTPIGNPQNLLIYTEAILYYDKVLAIDPQYVYALNKKGKALDDLGNHTGALTYYDKVLAIQPNDTDALTNKGVALSILGNHTGAIEYYDKALSIDPKYENALYNKGLVLAKLGNHTGAIIYYNKALAIDPKDEITLYNKGLALDNLGNM